MLYSKSKDIRDNDSYYLGQEWTEILVGFRSYKNCASQWHFFFRNKQVRFCLKSPYMDFVYGL